MTPVKCFRIKLIKASSEVEVHVFQGTPFPPPLEKILALFTNIHFSTLYKNEVLFLRGIRSFNFYDRMSTLLSQRLNTEGY